jgi:hypothetical protein
MKNENEDEEKQPINPESLCSIHQICDSEHNLLIEEEENVAPSEHSENPL